VNRAVPKLAGKAAEQEQGPGSLLLAASKAKAGTRSKRLPTVKDGYHGEVSTVQYLSFSELVTN